MGRTSISTEDTGRPQLSGKGEEGGEERDEREERGSKGGEKEEEVRKERGEKRRVEIHRRLK